MLITEKDGGLSGQRRQRKALLRRPVAKGAEGGMASGSPGDSSASRLPLQTLALAYLQRLDFPSDLLREIAERDDNLGGTRGSGILAARQPAQSFPTIGTLKHILGVNIAVIALIAVIAAITHDRLDPRRLHCLAQQVDVPVLLALELGHFLGQLPLFPVKPRPETVGMKAMKAVQSQDASNIRIVAELFPAYRAHAVRSVVLVRQLEREKHDRHEVAVRLFQALHQPLSNGCFRGVVETLVIDHVDGHVCRVPVDADPELHEPTLHSVPVRLRQHRDRHPVDAGLGRVRERDEVRQGWVDGEVLLLASERGLQRRQSLQQALDRFLESVVKVVKVVKAHRVLEAIKVFKAIKEIKVVKDHLVHSVLKEDKAHLDHKDLEVIKVIKAIKVVKDH